MADATTAPHATPVNPTKAVPPRLHVWRGMCALVSAEWGAVWSQRAARSDVLIKNMPLFGHGTVLIGNGA